MAWATRADLEAIALPVAATKGIPDPIIERHLLIARRRVEAAVHDSFGDNPPEEIIAAQCEIAAWTIVTGYRGARTDDPTVAGLLERHRQAFAWLKQSRAGELGTSVPDATPVDEGSPDVSSAVPRGFYSNDDSDRYT